MRDIAAAAIEQAVRDLCIEANRHLPGDIRRAVQEAAGRESMPLARDIMRDLEEKNELIILKGGKDDIIA